MSRRKPTPAPQAPPLKQALFDPTQINVHCKSDIGTRKRIGNHKVWVTLAGGQILHGIKITRGLHQHVNIDIPQPCPVTMADGVEMMAPPISDLQRAMIETAIGCEIERRLRERRTAR